MVNHALGIEYPHLVLAIFSGKDQMALSWVVRFQAQLVRTYLPETEAAKAKDSFEPPIETLLLAILPGQKYSHFLPTAPYCRLHCLQDPSN